MRRYALGLAGLALFALTSAPVFGQPPVEPPPIAPDEPAAPSEPEAPSEPAVPNEPEAPSEPDAPSEPSAPNEPGAPSEPSAPGEPEAPGEPSDSAQAAEPDEAADAAPAAEARPSPAETSKASQPVEARAASPRHEKPAPRAAEPQAVVAPASQREPNAFAESLIASNERLPTLWRSPPNAVHLGLVDSALAVPLESLGLLALVTYTGFSDWKWGTASFRFNSEGWFGMNTGSGGMDKIGHAYGAYMASELLYWRLRASQDDRPVVSFYPAAFGMLLYLYIELFDGYSVDHGFAYEDVITDTLGVLLSTARNTIPAVRRGFDFRLEYFPSKGFDFHPVIDYEGQKFMGVFKLAAFDALERSPARFVELMVGYYTRGFDKDLDVEFKSSHLFFGVGFSLEQLFFRPLDHVYGWPFGFMGLAANYFQLPGTYMSVEKVRTAPTGKHP